LWCQESVGGITRPHTRLGTGKLQFREAANLRFTDRSHNIGNGSQQDGAFRGLSQNVMASATEATSDNIDRMQHEASDMVHKSGEQMSQMAQDANNYVQEPIH